MVAKSSRKGCGAALAVCFGLLVAFIIVEIMGRVTKFLPSPATDAYVTLTNKVGPLPDPSSRSYNHSIQNEYNVWLDFNAFGFRNQIDDFPDSVEKPGNQRILILGDSYAAAWQVPIEQRWSEQMTSLHPGWSILNTGTPGWGTDQEYLTYLNYPLRKAPDVVLLMFYSGNDVSDNARPIVIGDTPDRPYFVPKGGNNTQVESFDVLREVSPWHYDSPFDVPGRLPFPSNVRAWLHLHSTAYLAASRVLGALHPSAQPAPLPTSEPTTDLPAELAVFKTTQTPQWQTAWQITEALIKQIQTTATSRGTRFVIVMVPYYPVVQPELTPNYVSANMSELDLSLPYKHLAAFASANQIALLDLTAGFVQFHQDDKQHRDLYFQTDRHFTALGNCLAATLITNWLDSSANAQINQCR